MRRSQFSRDRKNHTTRRFRDEISHEWVVKHLGNGEKVRELFNIFTTRKITTGFNVRDGLSRRVRGENDPGVFCD